MSEHGPRRGGSGQHFAELVLWLGSPCASFVTGTYYPVDSAYLAH